MEKLAFDLMAVSLFSKRATIGKQAAKRKRRCGDVVAPNGSAEGLILVPGKAEDAFLNPIYLHHMLPAAQFWGD